MGTVELVGLPLPEIHPGEDLASFLVESAISVCGGLRPGDLLVVSSKVISKALGLIVPLAEVQPSPEAKRLATKTGLDPRFLEVVLKNSEGIVCVIPLRALAEEGILDVAKLTTEPEKGKALLEQFPYDIFVIRRGQIYSSAGVDASNLPPNHVSFLPLDLDMAARDLREKIYKLTGFLIPVVISDTEYTLGLGSQEVARGSYGLKPVAGKFGQPDRFGRPKFGGADLIVHELASAAALLMGQTSEGIPAVLVRGFKYEAAEEGMGEYWLGEAKLGRIVRLILRESIKVLGWKWLKGAIKFLNPYNIKHATRL